MISVTATNHYDVYYSQSANQLYCHTGHRASSTTRKKFNDLRALSGENDNSMNLISVVVAVRIYHPPAYNTLSQQVFRFLLVAKMI